MQVKFRGKRKGGNEWLIGDLSHVNGGTYIIPTEDAPLNSPDWFEVDPSSIGMFTGLTDKNGKEIYGAVGESGGDIVLLPDTETETVDVGIGYIPVSQQPYNVISVVKYRFGSFGFEIKNKGENWGAGWCPLSCTDYTKAISYDISDLQSVIEVIGNAFDNPELLEK